MTIIGTLQALVRRNPYSDAQTTGPGTSTTIPDGSRRLDAGPVETLKVTSEPIVSGSVARHSDTITAFDAASLITHLSSQVAEIRNLVTEYDEAVAEGIPNFNAAVYAMSKIRQAAWR